MRSLLRLALVNALPPALFDERADLGTVRRLFATYVKLVEIENHGYCNRTCWFCPNTFLDRRSGLSPMPGRVFEKILSGLADVGYDETLVWARYHEPLAHESIFENVARARAALPRAFLTMHSNGDYLTGEMVDRLERAGLDQLRLNLYVPNDRTFSAELEAEMLAQLCRRTGLAVERGSSGTRRLGGRRLDMPVHVPDFRRGMSTRGGLLGVSGGDGYVRTSACLSPVQHVVIDHDGKGVLCCQVRSDAPEHAGAVIGDLAAGGYGIFDLYRDLADARAGLVNGGPKSGVCRTCAVNLGGPDRFGRAAVVGAALSAVGASAIAGRMWKARARRYEP